MAKSKKENDVLFTFNGAKFYKNTAYKVNHKMDVDAPKSWRDKGLSKAPKSGDMGVCPYDEKSRKYDTGFEEYSPRYMHLEPSVRKNTVKNLVKNLVEPYMLTTGKTMEDLAPYNYEHWDSYMANFDEDKTFNTSNPLDAMQLYFSVISGRLVPRANQDVDLEGDPFFNKAAYTVYSEKEKAQVRNIVTNNRFKAVKSFTELLDTDQDMLRNIMMYIGLPVTNINTQDGLIRVFNNNVENEADKVKNFNSVVDKIEDEEGKMEVVLYSKLKNPEQSKNIRKANNKIYYDEVELAGNLKMSANKIATSESKKMIKVKNQLLGIE